MKEKWYVSMKKSDFNGIGRKFGVSPVLIRIIRNRDVTGLKNIEKYLNGTMDDLPDPSLLKDAAEGAEILKEKIKKKKKIRIIGDYDIDGVNATYILQQGLSELKADVDYEIPDRMKDGYGINIELIKAAHEAGIDTIITCDNGISAIEQVKYAKSLGMTVIITDHHELPFEENEGERIFLKPNADAIINPKQEDCEYPFKGLCGAAVAYRFLEVLYQNSKKSVQPLKPLIENVAIATVGDVMDLIDDNRIYVKTGLEMIKSTKNLGLKALIEVNGLDAEKLSAYHIGFVIGPCMNASGRLDSAKRALELLNTDVKEDADRLAGDLKALNESRKSMTLKGVEEAIQQIETTEIINDKVLVVYLPDCHESLAGIIAGRIRERYNKPVFVLTKGEEGVKGSGRSIEAYHMFDEMTKCKALFLKFGGHPMAAGLSMEEKNIEVLRKKLNELTELTEKDFILKVSIDVPMPLDYIDEKLVNELEILEPFGKGNSKPLFAEKNLNVINIRILGKNKNVLKLFLKNEAGCQMDALSFVNPEQFLDYLRNKFGEKEVEKAMNGQKNKVKISAAYYPGINEYMGKKKLQVIMQNYQ